MRLLTLLTVPFGLSLIVLACENSSPNTPKDASPSTGGTLSTGGETTTGGVVESGGILRTGGTQGTGGVSTGGMPNTGGYSMGGIPNTGGYSMGGATSTDGSVRLDTKCPLNTDRCDHGCKRTPNDCVCSSCWCGDYGWMCTADCKDVPLCPDAGSVDAPVGNGGASAAGGAIRTGGVVSSGGSTAFDATSSADGSPCSSDDDCRLQPIYCESCRCVALGAKEATPICPPESVVYCVGSPCGNRVPRCDDGICSVGMP